MKNLSIKTEIISNDLKGLCVYEKPFIFRISEDKKIFYYSEIGILVSCRFYSEKEATNPNHINKYCVDFQYDYRSADDLHHFGFVRNTGTYGINFYFDTLEEAIKGVLDFVNSEFKNYRTFSGEKIPQIKKASIREVAKSQSLHHCASIYKYRTAKEINNDVYFKIIKNAGEWCILESYIKSLERRENNIKKYETKLYKVFLENFNFDLSLCIERWTFSLHTFKTHFEADLNSKQKKILNKVINHFN